MLKWLFKRNKNKIGDKYLKKARKDVKRIKENYVDHEILYICFQLLKDLDSKNYPYLQWELESYKEAEALMEESKPICA